MNQKIAQFLFSVLLTITLFSFWAGFALLVVNQFFYKDLPGYTIGRICIWELFALIIAALIARCLISKWGNIQIQEQHQKKVLIMNPKFGVYFLVYFGIAILTGIWQFWIFSQKF